MADDSSNDDLPKKPSETVFKRVSESIDPKKQESQGNASGVKNKDKD